jgi:hypothetical protein
LAAIDTFSSFALKSSSFFFHIERGHPDANHKLLLKYFIQTFGALTKMLEATLVGVKIVRHLCSLVGGGGAFRQASALLPTASISFCSSSNCETWSSFLLGYCLSGDITDSIISLSLQDMTTCPNKMDFLLRQGILPLG